MISVGNWVLLVLTAIEALVSCEPLPAVVPEPQPPQEPRQLLAPTATAFVWPEYHEPPSKPNQVVVTTDPNECDNPLIMRVLNECTPHRDHVRVWYKCYRRFNYNERRFAELSMNHLWWTCQLTDARNPVIDGEEVCTPVRGPVVHDRHGQSHQAHEVEECHR